MTPKDTNISGDLADHNRKLHRTVAIYLGIAFAVFCLGLGFGTPYVLRVQYVAQGADEVGCTYFGIQGTRTGFAPEGCSQILLLKWNQPIPDKRGWCSGPAGPIKPEPDPPNCRKL